MFLALKGDNRGLAGRRRLACRSRAEVGSCSLLLPGQTWEQVILLLVPEANDLVGSLQFMLTLAGLVFQ